MRENTIPERVGSFKNLRSYSYIKPERKSKIIGSLEEAVNKVNLRDGMTVSFHHHFRDGDLILNQVMDIIADKGVKNLTLAATSLRKNHDEIIKHIKSGVIKKIYTSGLRGKLGEEICRGLMDEPVVIYSHGGRAGAIESGNLKIDVAFIATPAADRWGNANGVEGTSNCGSLGYTMVDAKYAEKVVVITDNLIEFPPEHISISQENVDCVVEVDKVGNSDRIETGSLRKVSRPKDLYIAKNVARVISNIKYFQNGFSLQTGSGGDLPGSY